MRPLVLIVIVLACSVAAAHARAETHRFVPTSFHTTFSSAHAPVLRIASGDRVVTATLDDTGADASGRTVANGASPHTGPFFVEGAEPGDLLVVTIEKLAPNRRTGTSTASLTPASVGAGAFASRGPTTRIPWTLDAAAGIARFDLAAAGRGDWSTRFQTPALELPLQPSLASVAVAPPSPHVVDTTGSGPFGGHMAAAALAAGTRVMLPVFHAGALLFLGHGHARQGDGAAGGTGIETSLDVDFSVQVIKRREWPHSNGVRPSTVVGEFPMRWPRLESDDALMTVGTAPTLLQALQQATVELHHWLDDDFGLNERAVHVFLGQAMEYEIARLGDEQFTVVARVRKSYLPRPVAP